MSQKVKTLVLFLFVTALFSSCFQAATDIDELVVDESESSVRILTRSAEDQSLIYPLHAYAFDANGSLLSHQQLSAPTNELRLSVPQQTDSRIVILSADPDVYDIPNTPTSASVIRAKAPSLVSGVSPSVASLARGYATSPLQMGFVDVRPTSANTTVTIQMHYQVASLSILLQGLPVQCTSAYITVASPASGLTFAGVAEGSLSSRIPLAPVSGTSSSGQTFATSAPVYLFPTAGSTTFTIAYNDAEGEQYASATYQAPLKAGTPYQLNGAYSDGSISVTGSVSPSEWADPVSLSFTFTNGGNSTISSEGGTTGGDSSSDIILDDDTIYPVSSIPQPLTLWNGHLVIATVPESAPATRATVAAASVPTTVPAASASVSLVTSSATVPEVSTSATSSSPTSASGPTAILTLLSLSDWSNLTSALNADAPTMAASLASNYIEYDLPQWRIPTEAEARTLSSIYRNDPDAFDALLTSAGSDPIVLTDDKGNNLRYLCEDATKTYSFKNNTVTNAGATVKTYHLRLVRTIRVQQQ